MFRPMIPLLAVLSLVACQEEPAEVMGKIADTSAAPRSLASREQARQRLIEAGPAATLTPDVQADLQIAASVVRLHAIEDQNAKLFGTGGGDPAMNGLYSYIAFFAGSADGWVSYRIGDFLDFEVLAVAPGQVDLSVDESVLDEASGEIASRTRRLIVRWTPGADGAPPTEVTVTPAR